MSRVHRGRQQLVSLGYRGFSVATDTLLRDPCSRGPARQILVMLGSAVLVLAAALPGNAGTVVTYGFENISANSVANAATGESQLSMTVQASGASAVLFTLSNTGASASTIADVYWDDASTPLLSALTSIDNSDPGVNYVMTGAPPNLPAGNNASPSFSTSFDAHAANPSGGGFTGNGVNPGESVGFIFSLTAGTSIDDVFDGLGSGAVRVGIHVQSFANGGSEAFVNGPPTVVPNPNAFAGSAAGLGFLLLMGRRRRCMCPA